MDGTDRNTKVCTKCFLEKPISGYHLQLRRNGQPSSECRECKNARQKLVRLLDVDGARSKDRAYRTLNRDSFNASNRKWAAANQDKLYEKRKRWAEANPDSVRKSNSKTREKLSDAYVAEKLGLPVSIAPQELIELKRMEMKIKRLIKEIGL